MARPEWGVKRTCQECGARFYDLKRAPILCPKCGVEFDLQAAAKPRRPRPAATGIERKDDAPPAAVETDADLGAPEGDGDEEDVIGDAPRFGEDDDTHVF